MVLRFGGGNYPQTHSYGFKLLNDLPAASTQRLESSGGWQDPTFKGRNCCIVAFHRLAESCARFRQVVYEDPKSIRKLLT